MKEKLMNALNKQKKILESQGYTVAFIAIFGSQNYGLDVYTEDYKSDIDMKAIIVPTLDDLVSNSKPVSKVYETEWGQVDVKDIRTYFQTLLKANPAYVETLFTEYYIVDDRFVDEFDRIFLMREILVKTLKAQLIRSIFGMMCEKQKALCHPYPSIAHKIEKWGYDGKQAHHILRLFLMMDDYFDSNNQLKDCFHPLSSNISLLMDLKLNKLTLEEVQTIVEGLMASAKILRDKVLSEIDESKIDYSIKNEFVELSNMIIKNKIIVECGGFVE